MDTPTIFDLCIPRAEVRVGTCSDADFAADLAQAVRQTGGSTLSPASWHAARPIGDRGQGTDMIRLAVVVASLLALVGCGADQSRGTALNECRMKNYLESQAVQAQVTPDCMAGKSFATIGGCGPATSDDEWEWQVRTFAYDNPQCYRPAGSRAWVATFLSPM
jgi:hypothetical protein